MLCSRRLSSYTGTVLCAVVLTMTIAWVMAPCARSATVLVGAASKPEVDDYVMLIDTSKSMAGFQGARNIFPAVKTAVNAYVGQLPVKSVVYVYSFDSQLKRRPSVELLTQGDRARVQSTVNGLAATGMTTAIYDALSGTLNELQRVRRADPGTLHVQRILLFTDGEDNASGMSFAQIARKFRLARADNPDLYLTYVTLGSNSDARWPDVRGVTVDHSPPSLGIQSVDVEPTNLDFGSLRGTDSSQRVVQITFDRSLEGAALGWSATSRAAERAGGLVTIEPQTVVLQGVADASGSMVETQTITLRLQNGASLDQTAAYSGRIDLTMAGHGIIVWSPQTLGFTFTLAPLPQIEVQAVRGTLSGRFGTINPYRGSSTVAMATRSLRAVFNNTAEAAGATVTVRLMPKSGTPQGVVMLKSLGGTTGGEVTLSPAQPSLDIVLRVPRGQAPGAYAYDLTFEPSKASLFGMLVDASSGVGVMPIRFSVAVAPTPLGVVILRWVALAAVAAVVVAIVSFIALCLITGSGPAIMAGLILHRLRPRLQDARVEVTAPPQHAQQFEISGKRHFDIGPAEIATMPFVLRFAPNVSVLSATDEAVVRAHPKDDSSFFTVTRATTGVDEPSNDLSVANGDVIKIVGTDGERCELVFGSFNYVNG